MRPHSNFRLGSLLAIIIVCSLTLHAACLVLGRGVFDAVRWPNHPVHSAVEMLGATIAVVVAWVLLTLDLRGEGTSFNIRIAAALGGMGILDGVHAFCHPGKEFVWLHSVATFVGGGAFALVWLPRRWAGRLRFRWVAGVCTAAVMVGVVSLAVPAALPEMLEQGRFTPMAKGLNVFGGVFFLAAAVRLVRVYWRGKSVDDLLFCLHCLLFGAAAIMFEQSYLWDVPWWGWHILRLMAYGVALGFVVHTDLQTRRAYLEGLERQVNERTADLQRHIEALELSRQEQQRVNAALQKEISRREHFEAQLSLTNERMREQMLELEQFNRLAVGREERMIELKRIVNRLTLALGQSPPYDVAFAGDEKLGGTA